MKIVFATEDLFIIEPLGIMQLIGIAKHLGHQCRFTTYAKNGFMEFVKNEKPDVIAISIMSTSDKSCKEAILKIKDYNKKIFVIVGGSHTTYYPEFVHTSGADAICVGEGDIAFAEVLEKLEKGGDITHIANIHTKSTANPLHNLIENLDEIPFADRDLVYKNTQLGMMKLKSFLATRGCPYSCTYCFNNAYKKLYEGKGRIIRRRSVDNLLKEIKMVRSKYPLQIIRFADDLFIERANDWFYEFVDKYPKFIGLPFYCLLNPKIVTWEIAKNLKRAGCVSVGTSIETGNEKIRTEILKRRISDQEIINACRILIDNGIKTVTNNMIGLPGTTIEDEFKSLDIAIKSKVVYPTFSIFTPYPGTELYSYCIEKKLIPKTAIPIFARSTTERSILNCFTEKEKDVQKNIMLLGPLINANRLLRKIIIKWLIYLPPNKIFFYISFLARNYYYYHVWPMSFSIKEFFYWVGVVLKHDKKYIE